MPKFTLVPVSDINFRKDLYPRIDHDPATVSRYAEDLSVLPPIEVNQQNILIDGWHRWTAHRQDGSKTIPVTVTKTASEAEVFELAVVRNAAHGLPMSGADKAQYAKRIWNTASKEDQPDVETRLIQVLSVSERWLADVLSRSKKDRKADEQREMARLWLAGYTQAEGSKAVGVSRESFGKFCNPAKNTKTGDVESVQEFHARLAGAVGWRVDSDHADLDPPLYDVWKAKASSNATTHPGQTEALFTDWLLYLFTKPGEMVIDPFAGGGTTIDVCKRRFRRYFVSDHTPIPAREADIRQHDLTTGLLKPPQWNDVALVYLDPPYGGQVKGEYSDEDTDLANMPVEVFRAALLKAVNSYTRKLREGAHVALVMQATQWHGDEGRERQDHLMALAHRVKRARLVERIQCPYESQQANSQMVKWAKANRRILTLSREIAVWRIGT